MDHIKYYENFYPQRAWPRDRIKTEIESILENIDINLNIDEWKFIDRPSTHASIVNIDLVNNNPVRKILEEIKYIRTGIELIDGVKEVHVYIRSAESISNHFLGGYIYINNYLDNHSNYITQLDYLNNSENSYWVKNIHINIIRDY